MSKQNRLSMESEMRRTHDFNLKVSVETILAVVCKKITSFTCINHLHKHISAEYIYIYIYIYI